MSNNTKSTTALEADVDVDITGANMGDYVPDPKPLNDLPDYEQLLKHAVSDLLVFLMNNSDVLLLTVVLRSKLKTPAELKNEAIYLQLRKPNDQGLIRAYVPPSIDELLDLASAGIATLTLTKSVIKKVIEDVTSAHEGYLKEFLSELSDLPGATLQQKAHHNPSVIKILLTTSLKDIISQINVNRDVIHAYVTPDDNQTPDFNGADDRIVAPITKSSIEAVKVHVNNTGSDMVLDMSVPRKICFYPELDADLDHSG